MAHSTIGKVLTFGEAIFRLSPPRGVRFCDAQSLSVYLGGTELNIASNLVTLGTTAAWTSVLPDGEIGDSMKMRLAQTGVQVEVPIQARGSPASYWLEGASKPRGDRVLTRMMSVLGHLPELSFQWGSLLKDRKWFHTSGVTAGLSEVCTAECAKALQQANEMGMTTSYDLNYRKSLWSEDECLRRQAPLLKWADVLVLSEREFKPYLGFTYQPESVRGWSKQNPKRTLLVPRRNENETEYWLEAWFEGELYQSPRFQVEITDRIGVGDSMLAGWIHARLNGWPIAECADFAGACGAIKYSIVGDAARVTELEVKELLSEGYRSIKR